jgi:glycosyltransferase involved in cell wall biosynthesis
MMRIAFLTNEFVTEPTFSGGLANYLLRTCLALRQLGHEPTVFVLSEERDSFLYRGIEINRVQFRKPSVVALADALSSGRFAYFLRIVSSATVLSRALRNGHREKPFDIVQAASYQATNLFISRTLPSVVRVSSFEPLLREAYEIKPGIAQRMVEWLELLAMKRADSVYAPSQFLANKVSLALKQPMTVLEPPFVMDTLDLDWSSYENCLKGKSYFLFFGTIGVLKGCRTIAEMLEPLLADHPELYFVFVGKTTQYRERSMIDYIRQKAPSVSDRVLFMDAVSHNALYPIVQKAIAIVLPSRVDNLPNTCLEAMALGRIVVGTRGTSFEELIEDGVSGFLCLPDSRDSLLAATRRIWDLSQEERERISEMARVRVARLSPERVVPKLIAFYESVLRRRDSAKERSFAKAC